LHPATARTNIRSVNAMILFLAANVLFGAGLFAHAFLYNFYLGALGHGTATMGAAAAALTAGGLCALAPAGLLADRYGAARVYRLGCLVASAGLLTGAFVEQRNALLITAFIAGAGTACWRVAMGPLVMRIADGPQRARIFSFNVALLVGSGAAWTAGAGALPGALERTFGIDHLMAVRSCLALGALLTLCAALLLTAVRIQSDAPPSAPQRRWRATLPGRPILLAVAAIVIWMCAGGLVIPFMNVYFARVHSLPMTRIGVIFAVAQAATAALLVVSGLLAARYGARRVLPAWMLMFAPALWALGAVSLMPVAVALYFVQGIIPPATNPLIDEILLDSAPSERHGIVSSWRNAATELSGFVGALLGGVLLERQSFAALFGTAALLALVGALAVFAVTNYVLFPLSDTRSRTNLNARST
jgi:MFS family permease